MENQQLYPDTVSLLMKLMQQTFGDIFKAYYEGDPLEIPTVSLPCIIIEKVNTNVTNTDAPTNTDNYSEQISIKLVLNKLDDANADDTVDLTERKLRRYIEGRDATTGAFAAGTALNALRANLGLGSMKIQNNIDVSYDVQPRPNMQLTSEGLISIIVKEHIFVPNRTG